MVVCAMLPRLPVLASRDAPARPEHEPLMEFEMCDGYACFRASGELSFHGAVGVVAEAISEASNQGIKRLLVDTVNLRGFPHPTTAERYFMSETWASKARGLRLAVVA